MAIDEIDIWRTAGLMVKRHGEAAATQAAQRADELLENGDPDGAATWRRILRAIEALLAKKPADGSSIH